MLSCAGEDWGSALDHKAIDLNYGPTDGVQLTATLPIAISHDWVIGLRERTGDVELAAKYRFIDDQPHGFPAAISSTPHPAKLEPSIAPARRALIAALDGQGFAKERRACSAGISMGRSGYFSDYLLLV